MLLLLLVLNIVAINLLPYGTGYAWKPSIPLLIMFVVLSITILVRMIKSIDDIKKYK